MMNSFSDSMRKNVWDEENFEVRVYTKGELAMLYLPGRKRKSAVKTFMVWLRTSPELWKALQEAGLTTRAVSLTPLQVSLIVKHLGTP